MPALATLYDEIEQPLVPVLRAHGAPRRADRRARMLRRAERRARPSACCELQRAGACARPASEFNLDSPKQLQQILFEKLQLPVLRKTPTGQPSTAEDVLEELAGDYALPRLILEYRGLAKLKSTYTDKLPEQIDPTHRPRAHLLSPGGGRDRPAVLDRSEPAEHPDPHAGGPAHPPGLHRAAGLRADGGRLLADRAAHHGAPVRRRRPAARLRRRPGRPPGHRRRSVRRRARSRSPPTSAARPRRSTSA